MPVPIPGSKVGSDSQKVKFLTISGRPKTGIFGQISGVPGPFPQFPLATNHAVFIQQDLRALEGAAVGQRLGKGGLDVALDQLRFGR